MNTMTVTRHLVLAVTLLALAGTGCGSCGDPEKKKTESTRPQAGSLEEYSKHRARRNLASEALGREAGSPLVLQADGGA